MSNGNLSAHHIDQIIQISAMHHVRQHRAVHLFVFDPISAVQIWNVKIIALIAPTFIKNLFEFFLWIQIHAQREIQAALARLRWSSIRIDDEERRRRRPATESRGTTAASGPSAIYELVAVCADVVIGNAVDEYIGATITEPVTNQFAAAAESATTAALAAGGRLQIENDAVSPRMQG